MEPETAQDISRFQPVIEAAERVLTASVQTPVELGETEVLSDQDRRNALLRCRNLSGSSPSHFIIKQVVAEKYNPDDTDSWDVKRFFKDWAGVRFLSELEIAPAFSPRYYGGDRALGFFVIEDLGPHRSLVEPLLEETYESAGEALRAYSSAVGRMHAATLERAAHYRQIGKDLRAETAIDSGSVEDIAAFTAKIAALFEPLGIEMDGGATAEIARVYEAIENPGPFDAFIHGDACPDNIFITGKDVRLIDFEFAHYGHALTDAVYGRMLFPTCWCCNRLPPQIVLSMETAYRTELARALPQAQDDAVYEGEMLYACAHWALRTLSWQLERTLKEDSQWGIATVRSRVLARLEAFISISKASGQFPGLRGVMSSVLDALRQRWPETEPLPLYPAFREKDERHATTT